MSIFYSPIIKPDDYNSFRDIINSDMPNAFNEWTNQQAQADLQHAKSGINVKGIEVDPDKFRDYLRAAGAKATRHELNNFAFHQATLNRDKK
jgi:hypothetical protein